MVQKVQIKRTQTPDNPPATLDPGELALEMATPTRLWAGVPTTLDPSGKKLLFDSGFAVVAEPPIAPGTIDQYWRGDKTWQLLARPHGQCVLWHDAQNTGQLYLSPKDGNRIIIDDVVRQLSATGPSLAAAAAVTDTKNYLYAFWNGTAVMLEASPTNRAIDPRNGVLTKNGDPTRTFVGLAWPVSGAFKHTANQRLVRSYFNEKGVIAQNIGVDGNSASTVLVPTSAMVTILCWAEELLLLTSGGSISVAAGAPTAVEIGFLIDGTIAVPGGIPIAHVTANLYSTSMALGAALQAPREGAVAFNLAARWYSGSGSWQKPSLAATTMRTASI